ncbi:MAG: hybrid sensor histidine kinase/response regulator [Chloroflexi bacterium]|nr:hybrid sensor histidine kinase/response regulator [Chloroflexota bacterium]
MTLDARARAELLATFAAELEEHRQTLTRAFLGLEKEPPPAEQAQLLDEAFRAAHSLKGAARAVAHGSIEALAHGIEGALAAVRAEQADLSPELFDLLYATVDTLANLFDERGEASPRPPDVERLLHQLGAVQTGQSPAPAVTPVQQPPAPSVPAPTGPREPAAPRAEAPAGETIRLPAARLDRLLEQLGELVVPQLAIAEGLAELAELRRAVEVWQRDWRKVRPRLRQLGREATAVSASLRLIVRFLERNERDLAVLGSGLAILQARIADPAGQLSALAADLQAEVKSMRMVPFGGLADGLERALRDLARSLGKEARLVLAGGDTELDRHVLEEMRDPLLHLLRNAVDHGVEPPAERQRLGKASVGTVAVTVAQRGGTIAIEVEDDGAGVDVEAIRRAAGERGLIPPATLASMAADDVARLVFLPGLSTRRDVSELSGRGIGLDVVARNAERLGGRVDVRTAPGRGTRFAIVLPLTLATTRAVLVEAAGALYALPTAVVERVLRPEHLGGVGGRPTLEHDGAAILVASLASLLDRHVGTQKNGGTAKTLALIRVGTQRIALAVDRVVGEQEIVVKPLGYPLLRLRYIAAATILGSGRVVPILNAADLMHTASRAGAAAATPRPAEAAPRRLRVLVVEDSLTTRTLERHILEAAGYEVEVAGDGAEALSILQERGCDVLVSDVNMPVLDGIALTAKVRADPKLRDLPVILVTALDSPEDRERGLQVGADAYIVKGAFDQDYLLRTIREMTE